jgi:uncharacterized protein HemY
VLEGNPKDIAALNNLALLWALEGTALDRSLRLICQAIDIYGPIPQLLDTRATVYLARNESQKALNDLKMANTKAPDAAHYFHLAQAYQQLAQGQLASETLAEADRLGLRRDRLHPLERSTLDRIRAALN